MNVVLLGFSYIGYGDQSSIGILLKELLQEHYTAPSVKEISYGGLSIDSMASILPSALTPVEGEYYLGLDLSTSHFSLHNNSYERALSYVSAIAVYVTTLSGVKPFFVNMFRSDLKDVDCVTRAIDHCALKYGIPVLDLKREGRLEYERGNLETTDGIHPAHSARQIIARKLLEFIRAAEDAAHYSPGYRFIYHDLSVLFATADLFTYEGRGKSLTSGQLLANESVAVKFENKTYVEGIFFLFGPETGYIKLAFDEGGHNLELPTYDEHSYYRRVGYRSVGVECRSLVIESVNRVRDIQLRTKTVLEVKSRRDFICGLSLRMPAVDSIDFGEG